MKYGKYILLLRMPMGQASGRPRWTRKTMQTAILAVVCVSFFTLWNYASILTGDDLLEEDEPPDPALDTVYLPFRPVPYDPSQSPTVRPTLDLPKHCLDAHIAQGELCSARNPPPLDILWTWVNGSDILQQDAKARVEELYADSPYRPVANWKTVRQFRSVILPLVFV